MCSYEGEKFAVGNGVAVEEKTLDGFERTVLAQVQGAILPALDQAHAIALRFRRNALAVAGPGQGQQQYWKCVTTVRHALLAIHQCGLLARTCFTWSTVISPPLLSQLFRIKVMTLATCSSVSVIAGITLLKDSPLTLIGPSSPCTTAATPRSGSSFR